MLQFYYEMVAEERIDTYHSKVHRQRSRAAEIFSISNLKVHPLSHRRLTLAATDRQRIPDERQLVTDSVCERS